MYGRYTKDLGEYAKDEARRLKQLERQRKKDDRARDKVSTWSGLRNIEYKAAVVGIYRSFLEKRIKGKSSEQFLGVGAIHLLEWGKTGYS